MSGTQVLVLLIFFLYCTENESKACVISLVSGARRAIKMNAFAHRVAETVTDHLQDNSSFSCGVLLFAC